MGEVKNVRQSIDEMNYTVRVPKESEIAREIGNRVKLWMEPVSKEKRDNDRFAVNYYKKQDWDLIGTIVRVAVAENTVKTMPVDERPKSLFTVYQSDIFGTEKGCILINDNKTTRKYLFPLLSFRVLKKKRLKQAFDCEAERIAYKKRIVDLMNAIWVLGKDHNLDLDAEPYVWCKDKKKNIDKTIRDLTEIVRCYDQFGGTTLEEIALENGIEIPDKAWQSHLYYELEVALGYKVYKRVLKKGNVTATARQQQWPNDDWPTIVLRREIEAPTMKKLLLFYQMYFNNPVSPTSAGLPGNEGEVVNVNNGGLPVVSSFVAQDGTPSKRPRI